MSGHLISMAVILVSALVVLGVVAAKNKGLRAKIVGVAGGVAAALAAIVAVLVINKEKKRAGDIAASTKQVRGGREEAKEDAKETERELDAAVSEEVDAHQEASDEQESLKSMKRERLKA